MQPAKKRRIAAARAAAENHVNQEQQETVSAADKVAVDYAIKSDDGDTNGVLTTKLLEQHRETLKTLQASVSDLADGDRGSAPAAELLLSSTLALSTLKSLQRKISLQVEAHANTSRDRRERVEECSLVLENLNYERNYLRGEIASMRGWKAGELEKMAWNELGIDPDKSLLEEGEEGETKKEEGEAGDVDMEDVGKANVRTAEEAIDAYLLGEKADGGSKSHRDPSNHDYVVGKLQSDLQTRSSLVKELSKSKLELRELQKKRDDLRNFLNQIPKRLMELERAGESLNNFFDGSNVWKDVLNDDEDEVMDGDGATDKKVRAANLLVNRPSCDRTRRFQLAQSNLPSPLYVLFVQLVGYLDAWKTLDKLGGSSTTTAATATGEKRKKSNALDGFVGANGMDVSAVPPEKSDGADKNWSVVLKLSPSEILPAEISSVLGKGYSQSRSPSRSIKIVFSYSEEQGVVYASMNEGENNEGLLDDLFPGDDGLTNPNVSLSLLKREEDENADDEDGKKMGDDNAKTEPNGKPYYWCQVLSGLNFPPPSSATKPNESSESEGGEDAPFQIETCTKAVFRQLLRRIRARKTLSAVLEFLTKRSQLQPLPIHPAMRSEDGANQPQSLKAKLHSWSEDSSKDGKQQSATAKSYIATIKRKSSTLKATVVIDTRSYPAEPPVWSLQNEDGSSGTLSCWGEEHGNVSSLHQNSSSGNATSASNVPPLFDAALHRIECHVNQQLDKFVRPEEETTYDWILIHQLADIVSCWDEVMSAGEGGGKGKGGDDAGMMGGHGRARKGKDRRLMGFGERSPLCWYRNGL